MKRQALQRLQQVARRGPRFCQVDGVGEGHAHSRSDGGLAFPQDPALGANSKAQELRRPLAASLGIAGFARPSFSVPCLSSLGVSGPSGAVSRQVLLSSFHSSAAAQAGEAGGDSEAEQRSPATERVTKLVEEIAGLTLLEVADLTTLLKKRLGLPDMPMGGMPMMMAPGMMAAGGAAPGGQAAEAEPAVVEKTSFDVKLEKFDAAAKLKIIKEVRAITGLGLKESKELVESAPAVLKKGVPKDEAESIVEKLKAVGAEMSLD